MASVDTESSPMALHAPKKKQSSTPGEEVDLVLKESAYAPVMDDPLRNPMMEFEPFPTVNMASKAKEGGVKGVDLQWRRRRDDALKGFALSDMVCVSGALIQGDVNNALDGQADGGIKKRVSLSDAKLKLEYLETHSGSQRMNVSEERMMSQEEYIELLQKQQRELLAAWARGERVMSLKLAIQSAKVLRDVSNVAFYPSTWFLVVDILDTFSDLVYKRLDNLAKSDDPMEGPDVAKERCVNWFFKISCIRELVPRIYIEAALLRCYSFIKSPKEITAIAERLACSIRGVGNPVAAAYCRAFLAKNGQLVVDSTEYLQVMVVDYITVMRDYCRREVGSTLGIHTGEMDMTSLDNVHAPAFDVLLRVAGVGGTFSEFQELIGAVQSGWPSAGLLISAMRNFASAFTAKMALEIVGFVVKLDMSTQSKTRVFSELGAQLIQVDTLDMGKNKLRMLNDIWRVIKSVDSIDAYAACASTYIEVGVKHYSIREVGIMLENLVSRTKEASASQEIETHLERVCSVICSDCVRKGLDESSILTHPSFVDFLNQFKSDQKNVHCRAVLRALTNSARSVSDPMLIHAFLVLSRDLHDGLDALSSRDDVREISNVVCSFINKVDFGTEVQQQLEVYVDFRGAFQNLEAVKRTLVLKVVGLGMKASRLKRGKNKRSKRFMEFIKGCLAYCFITIPSINSEVERLKLLALAGQVSLQNENISQTDAFIKASIATIGELPVAQRGHQRSEIMSALKVLINVLSFVPGNSKNGPFYLVKGFTKALERSECFDPEQRIELYIACLPLFTGFAQKATVQGVLSNNRLYGGNQEYLNQLEDSLAAIVERVLTLLGEFTGSDSTKYALVLRLVNSLLAVCQLNDSRALEVVRKLLSLAKKLERKLELKDGLLGNTLSHVRYLSTLECVNLECCSSFDPGIYEQLLDKTAR